MKTKNNNYNGTKIPYNEIYICKDVVIRDNDWLVNSVMIQVGSVVIKDIPAYAIAGRHPAKIFLQKDIGHYKKLKHKKDYL